MKFKKGFSSGIETASILIDPEFWGFFIGFCLSAVSFMAVSGFLAFLIVYGAT